MRENSSEQKIGASKTNLQVCSILLAAISLALKFSELSKMPDLVRVCVTAFLGLAMMFLIIAIFLEADAVFNYSRGEEERGDYFDKYGYKIMKGGLLFVLIVMNYLASSLFPPLMDVPVRWSQLLQASLPILLALIPYIIWRIFKCRRIGCKWYS